MKVRCNAVWRGGYCAHNVIRCLSLLSELDVSRRVLVLRRVSVSRHVSECLALALPMSRLGLGTLKVSENGHVAVEI